MSEGNTVAPTGVDADGPGERAAFDIPADMATRYTVRVVESPNGGDRRLGMFLAGDRQNPSLEIANDRIVARNEDPETVAALVKLAQHNGWDKIDVRGSPEFTKAVWEAGSRAGLSVSGYEPTFAEAERMENMRRAEAERADRALQAERTAAARSERAADREDAAVAASVDRQDSNRDRATGSGEARVERQRDETAERRHDSEELAELFLHGAAESVAAEPRLASALRAQTVMEQHIAEVFRGDATQIASETRESRQMISDVLRRGLDVSVREPTPVRQIEPVQSPPPLER
ncbi:MAG TPA: LPD7 domain-containing protein [Sphingomicrobium sp.]